MITPSLLVWAREETGYAPDEAAALADIPKVKLIAWTIRWVGLSWVWTGISVVSLSVSAAYRTARLDPGPNFSTGPQILLSAEWLDAIPVILGLGLFLLQRTAPNKTDAGNGSKAICRVSNVLRSPSPDPRRWETKA